LVAGGSTGGKAGVCVSSFSLCARVWGRGVRGRGGLCARRECVSVERKTDRERERDRQRERENLCVFACVRVLC
jgi:hypothetical protein